MTDLTSVLTLVTYSMAPSCCWGREFGLLVGGGCHIVGLPSIPPPPPPYQPNTLQASCVASHIVGSHQPLPTALLSPNYEWIGFFNSESEHGSFDPPPQKKKCFKKIIDKCNALYSTTLTIFQLVSLGRLIYMATDAGSVYYWSYEAHAA